MKRFFIFMLFVAVVAVACNEQKQATETAEIQYSAGADSPELLLSELMDALKNQDAAKYSALVPNVDMATQREMDQNQQLLDKAREDGDQQKIAELEAYFETVKSVETQQNLKYIKTEWPKKMEAELSEKRQVFSKYIDWESLAIDEVNVEEGARYKIVHFNYLDADSVQWDVSLGAEVFENEKWYFLGYYGIDKVTEEPVLKPEEGLSVAEEETASSDS